ncbi:MAG: hypothetical protein AAF802_18720 [Planctomycetota bacterium]
MHKPISVSPRPIEEVVGIAMDRHGARSRFLYWPFLFHYSVFLILGVFPAIWISEQWNLGIPWAPRVALVFAPVLLLLLTYGVWAAFLLADDVIHLRTGEESFPWRHWILPKPVSFASLFLVVFVVTVCMAIVVATVQALMSWTAAASVGIVLLIWTIYLLGAGGMVIVGLTVLWPLIPLAFQGRLGRESIRHALSISLSNWLTSLLMLLGVLAMLLSGFALASIGLIVATPASALLLLVALGCIEGRLDEVAGDHA